MDETYSMLGRERQADFEREAVNRRLAMEAQQPPEQSGSRRRVTDESRARRLVRAALASLRARGAQTDT